MWQGRRVAPKLALTVDFMKRWLVLLSIAFALVPCFAGQVEEQLIVDVERSYVLETEISAILTIHGDNWVLQAEFQREGLLENGHLVRELNLRPRKAQLHLGPHVNIAFRVPAGPVVPPVYKDHVSYDATVVQVHFIPPPNSQNRQVLVVIAPFVANAKMYRIKAPVGDESLIPLKITPPLP
jgi:hypothetical protein